MIHKFVPKKGPKKLVGSIIHCLQAPDSIAETKVRNSDLPGMAEHAFREGSQGDVQTGYANLVVVNIGIYFERHRKNKVTKASCIYNREVR